MAEDIKLGLCDREPVKQEKPRGETNEESQRPTPLKETVSSDRGTFPVK